MQYLNDQFKYGQRNPWLGPAEFEAEHSENQSISTDTKMPFPPSTINFVQDQSMRDVSMTSTPAQSKEPEKSSSHKKKKRDKSAKSSSHSGVKRGKKEKKDKKDKKDTKDKKGTEDKKDTKDTKDAKKKDKSLPESAEASDDEEIGGSPWEPTERKHLNVEDLDLDKSYVEQYQKALISLQEQGGKIKKAPRRRRWNYTGTEPLTDISKLIELGWDTREPDLDPTDLDGQIQRCKERIKVNIMPAFFQERLRRLELEKGAKIMIQNSESQDLSASAIKRLASLRETKSLLKRSGSKYENQLVTVRAIMAAYRSKALDWTEGLVTYWSQGQQLCQPRPFHWDEFEAINEACNRSDSFWVEGFFGLGKRFAKYMGSAKALMSPATPLKDSTNFYNIALRLPGAQWWTELEFLYDTGCSEMHLFEADLDLISGPERGPIRVVQYNEVHTISEVLLTPIIELEGTILNAKGHKMCPWLRLPCRVDTRDYEEDPWPTGDEPGTRDLPRLDGGLFRKYLYYMTSPDAQNTLKIAESRMAMLPMVRGLPKAERVDLIDQHMQFDPIDGEEVEYIRPSEIRVAERRLLRERIPDSPPAEQRFWTYT